MGNVERAWDLYVCVPFEIFIKLRGHDSNRVLDLHTWAVRKTSCHFENLENRFRGLDVTWQSVRGDLTVLP
jgi:hypothetical protein